MKFAAFLSTRVLFIISSLFFALQIDGRAQNIAKGLKDLIVNYGEISPQFRPDITSYTLIVSNKIKINEIKFVPVSNAKKIRVNNQNVSSGKPWVSVNLNIKKIKIETFDTLGAVKVYYIFIERLKPHLYVSDSVKLKNVLIETNVSKRPKWMDKNGSVYATSGDTIYKSVNKGIDWRIIHVVPDSLKGDFLNRSMLLVSDHGRIIYCCKGNVMVSDENQKNFSGKYTFLKLGSPRFHLGYSAYDSIILLGSYETHSDTIEVIASADYGSTWKRIFFMKNKNHGSNFHVHDVQYDRYAKKIMIVVGDADNCQIYSSKDWGNTWEKVFRDTRSARLHQTSQILFFAHGAVLGSDVSPDGLMYIPRNNAQNVLKDDKVVDAVKFIKMDTAKGLKRFAVKTWESKKGSRGYFLLPWYHCIFPSQHEKNDCSRLWLSYNGIEWYELYKWKMLTVQTSQLFGFTNILGPDPTDTANTVFSNFHGARFFKAQIQFPEKLNKVKLSFPENKKTFLNESLFEWTRVNFAYDYGIQISLHEDFSDIIAEDKMIVGVSYFCDKLSNDTKYYWRVKAVGIDGEGDWSDVREFNTAHAHKK